MAECSLIDLHTLGPDDPPPTYKYGTGRRIDYMLGSPNIADSVRRAGYLSYDDGIFRNTAASMLILTFTFSWALLHQFSRLSLDV
jgi:hypothetical protein